mmetsp:Transcript_148062/g.369116  ORF Transcript_148062/g.369116 Transcript_148062/m.369116 type:complete len:314 (-) Transcript_148062:105-1046(-)
MRVKRQKNFRRSLRFYRLAFGVQQPYKVVVDGTFLTNALQNKIHVKEQLPKMLSGKVTPMVTTCMLNELRTLGDRGAGAAFIAKGYYRVKCGHQHNIGAAKCIKEQIGTTNERKLFVATQDVELALELRKIPGVPIIRLNGQVPYLEEPSNASKSNLKVDEEKKLQPSKWELPKLPALEHHKTLEAVKAERKPAKRKGPKGPNPLSCLKSKKNKQVGDAAAAASPAPHPAEPQKPKRTRSRRMGTVTRAEAEARATEQANHGATAASDLVAAVKKGSAPPRHGGDDGDDGDDAAPAVDSADPRGGRRKRRRRA